ncbi:hypothetical protein BC937DRAFT_91346 [Endogone sp. FLAS-F59071]|nr:hypothetical protein BC937DRAFT_91346 [Endogone sp. FLAS-F59071]|eukprot:RUS16326.1 hypothetical protein BC937DRAFT_91346 [Endogone sp. FLAS-F59071]
MSRYLDLSLICPHRLKSIMDTVDGLTDTSPQHIAFSHYACTNTRCPTGHPSRFRGTPGSWDRSRLASNLVVSEEGSVIELPGSVEAETVRTARISGAFTSGLCEWDIIVESPGICRGMAASLLGLVGETFDKFHTHIKHFSPILCMESFNSSCYLLGMDPTPDYGTHLYSGDIVTFHLDMNERTCSLSINGKKYGTAWLNLPNKVYAAVTLFPKAKYRFRSHSTK